MTHEINETLTEIQVHLRAINSVLNKVLDSEDAYVVSGAFLNNQGSVTLCCHGQEENGFGFKSRLYTAPHDQREKSARLSGHIAEWESARDLSETKIKSVLPALAEIADYLHHSNVHVGNKLDQIIRGLSQ